MNAAIEFISATALDRDSVYICGSLDSMPAYSLHARLMIFDKQSPYLWTKHDVNWWCVATTVFVENDDAEWKLCALSNEGQVELLSFSQQPVIEKIAGAGVHDENAEGWGYLSDIRQIGDHLYACGGGGQVYKRRAANDWVNIGQDLLQRPDSATRLLPRALAGASEESIYLVGSISSPGLPPAVLHWDGVRWRHIELPPVAERITNLYIEDNQNVWLCGANGTLLLGNAVDGFASLSTVNDNQLFLSVCRFDGIIYLASNIGLFFYDPADANAGIRKVVTGLSPELHDANVVQTADSTLWTIGSKDIARFDGHDWERIQNPDNPPISITSMNLP